MKERELTIEDNEKSVSQILQEDLEPIDHSNLNNKSCGGVPAGWIPSTEYDESDDIEDAKKYHEKDMDYSGAFESDIIE